MDPATFGSSAANAFVHTEWVHGIKIVVGSNVWRDELRKLQAGDSEWVEQNSVYIRVDTPLYVA